MGDGEVMLSHLYMHLCALFILMNAGWSEIVILENLLSFWRDASKP